MAKIADDNEITEVAHHDEIDVEREKRRIDDLGDEVDPRAVGGEVDDLPKGYYLTPSFLGTVTAVAVGSMCHYLGFVLPASTMSVINQDIGK